MNNRIHKGMARVINAIRWRLKRAVFLARYEWFRSPPYVMPYQGFDLEYERGDLMSFRYSATGDYEPHVISYLKNNLAAGATVVDVGANVGFFSLAVLALVPKSNVHMFEPSPFPRGYLAKSIARNGLESRVTLNHQALYSEPGEMDFCVHVGKHSALDGMRDTKYAFAGESTYIKVVVTTLDSYVREAGMRRLDLLKIDVEGAELYVLQGARNTLQEFRPRVLFEIGQQNLDPYGLRPEDIYGFLQENGYNLQDMSGQKITKAEFPRRSALEHEFVAVPIDSH